ncbi:DUF1120 domain-containing protein [Pseudoxanthomonas sp. UTMC 1351]|uniref:DUF1120 domain-containing protein n=1 Tax=Pseudoxanthomonas sp. UTMC 1351 TaxID=2695853 RepID=UPI0034CF0A92
MNHLSKIALVGLTTLVSSGAIAQETTDLTVTGKAVPRACTPSLSAAKLDWGDVPLQVELPTSLQSKTLTVGVSCHAPTRFALQIADNKADSAPSTQGSRGFAPVDDIAIGGYSMRIPLHRDLPVDGGSVNTSLSRDDGESWKYLSFYGGSNYSIRSEDLIGFTSGEAPPTAIKDLSFEIHVTGEIRPRNELPLEEFEIAGSSTFIIQYL